MERTNIAHINRPSRHRNRDQRKSPSCNKFDFVPRAATKEITDERDRICMSTRTPEKLRCVSANATQTLLRLTRAVWSMKTILPLTSRASQSATAKTPTGPVRVEGLFREMCVATVGNPPYTKHPTVQKEPLTQAASNTGKHLPKRWRSASWREQTPLILPHELSCWVRHRNNPCVRVQKKWNPGCSITDTGLAPPFVRELNTRLRRSKHLLPSWVSPGRESYEHMYIRPWNACERSTFLRGRVRTVVSREGRSFFAAAKAAGFAFGMAQPSPFQNLFAPPASVRRTRAVQTKCYFVAAVRGGLRVQKGGG